MIFNRISYKLELWKIRGQIPLLEKFTYIKKLKTTVNGPPPAKLYLLQNFHKTTEVVSRNSFQWDLIHTLLEKKLNLTSFKTTWHATVDKEEECDSTQIPPLLFSLARLLSHNNTFPTEIPSVTVTKIGTHGLMKVFLCQILIQEAV